MVVIHDLASVFLNKLTVMSKGQWEFFPAFHEPEEFEQDSSAEDIVYPKESGNPNVTEPRRVIIRPQNNANYFIDGVEGYAIVGYVSKCAKEPKGAWPIVLGDYGVSCGELHKDMFKIVEYAQGYTLAYPEGFDPEFLRAIIKDSSLRRQTICLRMYKDEDWRKAIGIGREEIERVFLDSIVDNGKGISYSVIIDGYNSIIKTKSDTDNERYDADRIIGICKKFNLYRLSKMHKGLSQEIATLCNGNKMYTGLYQDTKAGLWLWFLKLRNNPDLNWDRATSDIVQCVVTGNVQPNDDVIIQWNKKIERFASPTCYGLDRQRWRTHFYPIYLTELYGKQMRNTNYLNMLAYGEK